MGVTRVAPIAGVAIAHEFAGPIQLEQRDTVEWTGTEAAEAPLVITHEVGDTRPAGMRSVLSVPPWCTFHIDGVGEPAAVFHPMFREVERLLTTIVPGSLYRVRYAEVPREPVITLQSELTAYSFALAARGTGLLSHACAFVTPAGDGVLCPGVSGTGKTTLALLLGEADPTVTVLTDDRAIVTHAADGVRLWGSPWPGAARIAGTASAPLRTVVFIKHGTSLSGRLVSPREAFRRIVNTLSMPLWQPTRCGHALELVDAIVSRACLLELTYPPTADAARWVANEVESGVGAGVQ